MSVSTISGESSYVPSGKYNRGNRNRLYVAKYFIVYLCGKFSIQFFSVINLFLMFVIKTLDFDNFWKTKRVEDAL